MLLGTGIFKCGDVSFPSTVFLFHLAANGLPFFCLTVPQEEFAKYST